MALSVNASAVASLPDIGKAGLVLVGLLCAYAIGLVLDTLGDALSDLVIRLWNSVPKKKIRSNVEICERIDTLADRRFASILTKLMAEKVLVRSLCLLSFISLVFQFWTAIPPVPWRVSAIVFVTYGGMVVRMEYYLRARLAAGAEAVLRSH